jgi:hypothetical protein
LHGLVARAFILTVNRMALLERLPLLGLLHPRVAG